MKPLWHRRGPWIAAAIVLVALVGLGAGLRAALRALEQAVVEALGPGAAVSAIRVGATAVEIEGLVIPAVPEWPASESLRAEQVRVFPTWSSLLSSRIEIARIEVEAPYLSMLRARGGTLRVLPSLLEPASSARADAREPAGSRSRRDVSVGEFRITGGTLELFDATAARKPWRIRVVELDARLDDVLAPSLAGRMPLELTGVIDGPQRDGRVAISGWLVAATRDLELRADLGGVDLLAFEPYLTGASKARLARGSFDLALTARVADRMLHAPGRLTLADLAFASGGSARVLGVPRDLLLASLQAGGGRIALDFSLEGRIDDPHFSLNEAFAARVAVALASTVGMSVEGLVEGALGLGLGGVDGAGEATGGVGSVLRKLLPRR